MPWAAQLPYKALGPIREKIGGFAEVVVFDRPTQSLLVTDLVCSVAEEPPAILAENDVRALLYHSRDGPAEQALTLPLSLPLTLPLARLQYLEAQLKVYTR